METEWDLWRKPEENSNDLPWFNWTFKGDLTLDLQLTIDHIGPYFEMARFLHHPALVDLMMKDESDYYKNLALRDIKDKGDSVDVIWEGHSPEDLEEYCKEHFLPLPESYTEAWESALSYCQSKKQNT